MGTRFDCEIEGRLLSVDSRRVPLFRFDVIVCGGGAAGASAALAAADEGAEVAVLLKGDLEESNTSYAQGGMAAVLDVADTVADHVADTLAVGCGLSEAAVVESVIAQGPAAVERIERLGARFDRDRTGAFLLSREGGHRHARIVHARGDATGREIQEALTAAMTRHPRITLFPRTFLVDLLCAPSGAVVGGLAMGDTRELGVYSAGSLVLATGGAGQVYRETTNPAIATGDGLAVGLRAGAHVRDLEFFQFHPTLLYIAGAARVLVSEIVRGAGGLLRDRDGVRFMPEFDPRAELAPRDVVSRAIFRRMVETRDTSVYLDLSELDQDPHESFPGISRICRFFGIDIARDPVPVRPGAHYMIGGLAVDLDGRTSVPNLWAVGECAGSGLHGANRMGSNSLLEGLVQGARAGRLSAIEAEGRGLREWEVRPPRTRSPVPAGMSVNVDDVTYSLKSLLWRQLGIERNAEEMEDALAKIRLWSRAVDELAPRDSKSFELQNMLTVAHLTAVSALTRTESRGVHFRTDHPETDPAQRAHTRIGPVFADGSIRALDVTHEPVPAVHATHTEEERSPMAHGS